jgi:hypothetical protein
MERSTERKFFNAAVVLLVAAVLIACGGHGEGINKDGRRTKAFPDARAGTPKAVVPPQTAR